mmetsp:Transcript_15389/g.45334  ORF Transcript_15389/g.45334 Transcript_15389/m.45334 type:complete len:132 (-) Transcript_15389:517-912(-)
MSSWVERVASDLAAGAALAREAAASGKLPTISSVPANVAETCSYTAAATVLVAMLLAAPRARRAVWDAVDTALAVVCLVLLLGVVLGMPFGAVYIGYRGIGFLLTSLVGAFPQLRALADAASRAIRSTAKA